MKHVILNITQLDVNKQNNLKIQQRKLEKQVWQMERVQQDCEILDVSFAVTNKNFVTFS